MSSLAYSSRNCVALAILMGCLAGAQTACSGSTSQASNNAQGGSSSGGTTAQGGSSSGGTTAQGGSSAGGTHAASQAGGTLSSTPATSSTSTINCSLVGCAAPPLCSTGCKEPCGCCPCSEGSVSGNLTCKGGCYAETGGSSSGGSTGAGTNTSTRQTNVCSSGCDVESPGGSFCGTSKITLVCLGPYQANQSSIMTANSCTDAATGAVRYCCPAAIMTQCK